MIEKQEINENETVTMTESLTVIGDIKSGAKISLKSKTPCQLIVQGAVDKDVEINWRGSITFEQDFLGNNIQVTNYKGDITAKNLGENTCLKTHKGNIAVDSAKASKLISHEGNLRVETLSESKIVAHLGDVVVTSFGNNNELSVYEGKITIKMIESEDMKASIKVYKGDLLTSADNAKHLKPEVFNGRIIDDENQISRPSLGR